MRRAGAEYVDPGQFLFGIIFGTLISTFLGGISLRREEVVAMKSTTEALPSNAVPVEMVGQTVDELSRGLSMMENTMAHGQRVRIDLVTDSMPAGDDLAQFHQSLLANGHHVSRPTAKIIDGWSVTSIVVKKGSPALALLIPLIPIAIIGGLITFAIIRIEKIANALMPILVVTFTGLIVLAVILTRKPVLSAAEKIALKNKPKLLASTIPTTSRHLDKLSPKTERSNDEESVWIRSGGGTVFNYMDMVPRHEFEEENKKAIDRGEMPATGEIKRGGKWERLPQTKNSSNPKPLKRQDIRIELRGWEDHFGFSAFIKDTGQQIADIDLPKESGISVEEALDYLEDIGQIERSSQPQTQGRQTISQGIPIFSMRGKPLEFDLCPDSPEYLAHTVDMTGWRHKLDQTFQEAIARARSG